MSLLDYTTINCSIPGNPAHLGAVCCFAAVGTWLGDGGWCRLDADALDTMREYVWRWSECASRAAMSNATLAGVLEASGPLCSPAPGAWNAKDSYDNWVFFGGYVVMLAGLCYVVFLAYQWELLREVRYELRKRGIEIREVFESGTWFDSNSGRHRKSRLPFKPSFMAVRPKVPKVRNAAAASWSLVILKVTLHASSERRPPFFHRCKAVDVVLL